MALMTCLASLLVREEKTQQWLLCSKAWANPSVQERRKSEVSFLRDFEEAGKLVICKEFGEDIADIAQLALQIDEKGLLQAVTLDPFGVGTIVDALNEVGITAFYDGRVKAPTHDKALSEIVRLERNPQSGKIDHPPNFSKDCADAVAGVVYGLTYRREIWARHGVTVNRNLIEIVRAIEDKDKKREPARRHRFA